MNCYSVQASTNKTGIQNKKISNGIESEFPAAKKITFTKLMLVICTQ